MPSFVDFADPDHLLDLARRAEAAGWEGFFLWDHVCAGDWAGPVVDPRPGLGAVAQVTSASPWGPWPLPSPAGGQPPWPARR